MIAAGKTRSRVRSGRRQHPPLVSVPILDVPDIAAVLGPPVGSKDVGDKLVLGELLGAGSHGRVFRGFISGSGSEVRARHECARPLPCNLLTPAGRADRPVCDQGV